MNVLAAGVNNTDINLRLGWRVKYECSPSLPLAVVAEKLLRRYSKSTTSGTNEDAASDDAKDTKAADGGWSGATPFPLIQGTDCCGRVYAVPRLCHTVVHPRLYLACRTGPAVSCSYAVADNVNAALIGRRCLVRSCQRGPKGFSAHESKWMGSDFNGAFAQVVKVIWTGWRGGHSLIAVHHAATAGLMHAAHGFATACE